MNTRHCRLLYRPGSVLTTLQTWPVTTSPSSGSVDPVCLFHPGLPAGQAEFPLSHIAQLIGLRLLDYLPVPNLLMLPTAAFAILEAL